MICIGHEDGRIRKARFFEDILMIIYLGNVIIGSVEGSRIAGKSLRDNKLAKVEVSIHPKFESMMHYFDF